MLRRAVLVLLSGVACVGCSGGGPKTRLGSLPFPGVLSLWDTADPQDLGEHVSEVGSANALAESSRGTVYTCKAGFVDLAHLRESADWTRYAYEHILRAFEERSEWATFRDDYHAEYRVALRIPETWSRFTAEARRSEAERAARVAAQRIAYLAMTWHEVATWFGDRIIIFIPEDRSSFTYDDMVAHVIGVRLGGDALAMVSRGEAATFDEAMTIALGREMLRLDAKGKDETYLAARAVEGRWWEGESCTKRQVATGLDGGVLAPWVVPGLDACAGVSAEPQRLSWEDPATLRSLAHVLGTVEMRSVHFAEDLGLAPGAVRPSAAFSGQRPQVSSEGWVAANDFMRRSTEVVHDSMEGEFGTGFDRP